MKSTGQWENYSRWCGLVRKAALGICINEWKTSVGKLINASVKYYGVRCYNFKLYWVKN